MQEKFNLSENEEQILETMWRVGRPLARSEIIKFTENKTWKESSIHIILNRLLEKGSIEVHDIVKTSTNFGRSYKPAYSKTEYKLARLKGAFERINPNKKEAAQFLSFMVDSKKISPEDLAELEKEVEAKKDK